MSEPTVKLFPWESSSTIGPTYSGCVRTRLAGVETTDSKRGRCEGGGHIEHFDTKMFFFQPGS